MATSFQDPRFKTIAAMLAFYGVTGLTLDSTFIDKWIRGDCGGQERWVVKTLTDPESHEIDLKHSKPSSIAKIAGTKVPLNPMQVKDDRQDMEKQLLTITCKIDAVNKEDDEDLHLVLHDGGETMVGEIVFPCCPDVIDGHRRALLEKPFKQFGPFRANQEFKKHTWEVTGVVFVDFAHGQTGMLPNCIELHPIVDIHPID